MHILIIGSEGFIGKNLVSFFNKKKHKVFRADIFNISSENYFQINSDSVDFASVFKEITYDLCINASGAANVQLSLENPELDYRLNVTNVFRILEAIRIFNPKCKFINFSSAAVYGNPTTLPVLESSPKNPISPYGWHKLYSELVCKEYHSLYSLNTLSLRVFSAYGPGLRKQLFWDWYQKQKHQAEFEIFGTGNETRDFIYIDDLLQAVELSFQYANFNGDSLNVANGEEVCIRDVADLFFGTLNYKGNFKFNNRIKNGDPVHWQADIGEVKKFGYKQSVSLDVGIRNYLDWLGEITVEH